MRSRRCSAAESPHCDIVSKRKCRDAATRTASARLHSTDGPSPRRHRCTGSRRSSTVYDSKRRRCRPRLPTPRWRRSSTAAESCVPSPPHRPFRVRVRLGGSVRSPHCWPRRRSRSAAWPRPVRCPDQRNARVRGSERTSEFACRAHRRRRRPPSPRHLAPRRHRARPSPRRRPREHRRRRPLPCRWATAPHRRLPRATCGTKRFGTDRAPDTRSSGAHRTNRVAAAGRRAPAADVPTLTNGPRASALPGARARRRPNAACR